MRRDDRQAGEAGYEACDDGNQVQTDACLNDCVAARCGDGLVQAGVEACDDGNRVDDDDCANDCTLRNGVQAFGEFRPAMACGDFSNRGVNYQRYCFQLRGRWLCTGQHNGGSVTCEDLPNGIRFTYDWGRTWPFRFTDDNQTCSNYHESFVGNFARAIGYRNFRITQSKTGNGCRRTYIDDNGNFQATSGNSGANLPYVIEYTN
ncbi:MAG: DUF4215 domain-containing protein [Myxococcota bacterium]|nr:DUF4215 domain-containing protein [Myxococcota bacterium]